MEIGQGSGIAGMVFLNFPKDGLEGYKDTSAVDNLDYGRYETLGVMASALDSGLRWTPTIGQFFAVS